jgi:hypothetical protein
MPVMAFLCLRKSTCPGVEVRRMRHQKKHSCHPDSPIIPCERARTPVGSPDLGSLRNIPAGIEMSRKKKES